MKKTKADAAEARKFSFFFCILIMLVFSVALPILLKTNTQVQYKSIYSGYSVGEIAEKNVYAKTSIDLVDSEATEAAKAEARAAVLPVFSFSNIVNSRIVAKADLVRQAVAAFDYETLVSLLGETTASKIIALDRVDILAYAYDIVSDILKLGYYNESEINAVKKEGYREITVSNIYQGGNDFESTLSLDDAFIVMDSNIREYLTERLSGILNELSATEAILLEDLILIITEPNILYDQSLTEHRRDDAAALVDTVVISITKGQILIEADHVVNHSQMELLRRLSTQSNSLSFVEVLGHIIFDAIVLSIGLFVFGMFLGSSDLHFRQHNFLLVAGFLISLVATFFLTLLSSRLNLEFSDSFLPIFFLPLFMTEVTGRKRIGFVSSFMLAAVMATIPTASIMTFFYCIICSGVCVFLIRFFNIQEEC